jgi:hypothetical protein
MKLIELTMIALNILTIAMTNLIYFLTLQLNFALFCLLAIILVATIQQLKLHSLKFELDNVNKWTTPAIMIRYASTLRYYLSRQN